MKNTFFYAVSLFMITFILANDTDEIKTIEIDGTLYKINASSLNITPYSDQIAEETSNESEPAVAIQSDREKKEFNTTIMMGLAMPNGDNLKDKYDSGVRLGLNLNCDKKINIFNKDFSPSYGIDISTMSGKSHYDEHGTDLWGGDNYTMTSILYSLSTTFDKLPIGLNLGAGLSNAILDNELHEGTYYSLFMNFSYKLPLENLDLYLNLMTQYSNGDGNVFTPYGLSLSYDKTMSF